MKSKSSSTSLATVDDCGICGGENNTLDCEGICDGTAYIDDCETVWVVILVIYLVNQKLLN